MIAFELKFTVMRESLKSSIPLRRVSCYECMTLSYWMEVLGLGELVCRRCWMVGDAVE